MDKQRGFDSIAKYYDRLAKFVFGSSIFRSQTFFLDRIPDSSKILVIGGGTGWWLKEFLFNRPNCKILYIEASAEMIKLARANVGREGQIHFRHGTEGLLTPDREFDAVITFYFLDMFSEKELPEVISRINLSIKPGALWLAADFVQTKLWHSIMLFTMYRFFKLISGLQNQKLPDWTKLLDQNGVKELERKMFFGGFIKTALCEVRR